VLSMALFCRLCCHMELTVFRYVANVVKGELMWVVSGEVVSRASTMGVQGSKGGNWMKSHILPAVLSTR
jgi:hypothetical protein